MSDFLTNLVERTVMPELVVRPRFITPYEQVQVPEIAFESKEQTVEQWFEEAPHIVDRERSLIPAQFEQEAKHEAIPRERQIDFEVLKPHPTVRNDDDDRVIDVPKQAIVKDRRTANIDAPPKPSSRPVLKLERQSIRASTIGKQSESLIDEVRSDQKDEFRRTTPSSITIRIGRVEVRATTAASPRATSRPQSIQRPSLDEYLERRSRGGRS